MRLTWAQRALGPAVVAAATVITGIPSFSWPAGTLDEMILLVYPMRMLDGDLPYRDFFAAYGPAHWWLLEGTYAVTSPTLLVARILGLAVHVGLALALFAIARPHGRRSAVLTGVLAALVLYRLGTAPYAWLTAATLCLWQVVLLRRSTSGAAIVGGVCAGLALSVRPDVLPLALLPAAVLLWRSAHVRQWLGGLAVGLLPLVAGLLLAPKPLLDDIVLGRAGRGATQSRLPFWPSAQAARELALILLVAIICLAVHLLLRRTREAVTLMAIALATLPQALQRVDATHLTYAGLLFLPLLPLVLEGIGQHFRRRSDGLLIAGAALVLIGIAGADLYPLGRALTGHGPRAVTVHHDGRRLLLVPRDAATTRDLLRVVDQHSSTGEALFVFDRDLIRPAVNDVSLYYLLPRLRSRAKHIEVTPGVSSEAGSGLKQDVERADILVLIDAQPAFRRELFPFQRPGSPEASDALRSEFCLVARVSYYLVYRRC